MPVRKTLKSQLLKNFIAVISITTLISCFIGTFLIDKWTMGQAQDRVSNSLNSAMEVLDQKGEVVLRSSNPALVGGSIGNDDFVRNVILSGSTGSSIEIIPYEAIRKEGEKIASRCVRGPTGKPGSGQPGEGTQTMP